MVFDCDEKFPFVRGVVGCGRVTIPSISEFEQKQKKTNVSLNVLSG